MRPAKISRGGPSARSASSALGAVFLGLGLLAGCGVPPPASQFPSADDALGRMKAQLACAHGVQGTAKVDVLSKQGRLKGEAFLFAVNPARVRFDVVSPFGLTLITLTSDGERFEMLDLQQKQFLEGPASACNLARMTQVPLEGHALVAILRGEAPLLTHTPATTNIAWNTEGFYDVAIDGKHDAHQAIRLAVHPDDLQKPWAQQRVRVLQVRVDQRGASLWRVDLDDHAPVKTAAPREDPDGIDPPIPPIGPACDAEAPRSIRMRVPHTSDDVVLDYTELVWNPPLVQGTFDQPMPRGVRRVPVSCR